MLRSEDTLVARSPLFCTLLFAFTIIHGSGSGRATINRKFLTLPLLCIIVNANCRVRNEGCLGTRLRQRKTEEIQLYTFALFSIEHLHQKILPQKAPEVILDWIETLTLCLSFQWLLPSSIPSPSTQPHQNCQWALLRIPPMCSVCVCAVMCMCVHVLVCGFRCVHE